MKLGKMLLVLAALAAQRAGGAAAQSLEIGLTRSYRSAGGQTVVDGFARIPFTALDTLTRGPNGVAAYRVAISVRDSANLQLVEQSWTRSLPARMLGTARGSTLEHFMFAASPGTYTVEVSVHDSASGRVTREQVPLTAFAAKPAASDLLLATAMRAAVGGDTTLASGELRKGSAIVQAAVRPLLTPQQAQVGYYLEWYGGGRVGQAAETAAVSVRILRADGTPVVATPAQQVPFGAGGGVTRAMIDLAGLPPGEYGFEVVVQGRDTTAARRAPFRMGGLESVALVEPPPPPDVFEGKSEATLDTLYAPLIYLMTSDETGIYSSLRRYREGGAAEIPGWRTDRGRIFIKYGPPQEVMQRPQAGNTLPYEVWKYSSGRLLKYVFMDLTQFGNYALIWTDDRREPSRPNWQSLLGPEGVQDVQRF